MASVYGIQIDPMKIRGTSHDGSIPFATDHNSRQTARLFGGAATRLQGDAGNPVALVVGSKDCWPGFVEGDHMFRVYPSFVMVLESKGVRSLSWMSLGGHFLTDSTMAP